MLMNRCLVCVLRSATCFVFGFVRKEKQENRKICEASLKDMDFGTFELVQGFRVEFVPKTIISTPPVL